MDCIKLNKDIKTNDMLDLKKKFLFEQITSNANIKFGLNKNMDADIVKNKLKLIVQQNISYELFNIVKIDDLIKLKKINKLNELIIGVPNISTSLPYYNNITHPHCKNFICPNAINLSQTDIKCHFFLQIKLKQWDRFTTKTTICRNGDLLCRTYCIIQSPLIYDPTIETLITNIKLPCGIKKITLYDIDYNELNYKIISCLDKLKKLEELYICVEEFNSPMENLPIKLKILSIFSDKFAQQVNILPENLKYLYINSSAFDNNLDSLPQGLKVLSICSCKFTHKLENLPLGLEILHLNIGRGLDKPSFFDYLPESLICLYLTTFNFINDLSNLPIGLKVLYVGTSRFRKCSVGYENLPPNIKQKYIE